MEPKLRRRVVLHAGLLLGAGLTAPRARACEFFATSLRVYRPWTRATGPEDTTAILCLTFDQVTEADRLVAVETPVAEGVTIGGIGVRNRLPLSIPAGRDTVLTEEGTHLVLTGLKQPLLFGRTYPVTYVFERGGRVIGDVDVDYERKT
jgi:copper(I)-binding protein